MGKRRRVNYDVSSSEDLIVRAQLDSIDETLHDVKRKITLLTFITVGYILYQTKMLNKITDRFKESEKGD